MRLPKSECDIGELFVRRCGGFEAKRALVGVGETDRAVCLQALRRGSPHRCLLARSLALTACNKEHEQQRGRVGHRGPATARTTYSPRVPPAIVATAPASAHMAHAMRAG